MMEAEQRGWHEGTWARRISGEKYWVLSLPRNPPSLTPKGADALLYFARDTPKSVAGF